MIKRLLLGCILSGLAFTGACTANDITRDEVHTPVENEAKLNALEELRHTYAANPYRKSKLSTNKSLEECIQLLNTDGQFKDMLEEEKQIRDEKMDQSIYSEPQVQVSLFLREAFERLWVIAESFRQQEINTLDQLNLRKRAFKAFIRYGSLEDGRANVSGGRFHASCFAIPLAAVNSYFCFFEDMERVENGQEKDPLFVETNRILKTIAYQSWTQPYRDDETDDNVVSVDRFRKHVWWVGGNALAYRPVLATAILMTSVPMMDVMAEVASGALSQVSHTTYEEAFWNEGFTADGAGWGHGRQCLVWGYPVDGGNAALWILESLAGTPWQQSMERRNIETLLHYIRASSWYYYNGFVPPCLDRNNMIYAGLNPTGIKSAGLASKLLKHWSSILTDAEKEELSLFMEESEAHRIRMVNEPEGVYTGTRWYYNNDNLVVKNDDFHFLLSMASVRCDGIESAHTIAAKYNIFTCDGLTLFQRKGNEAKRALGGMDLTASPGITAREGHDQLKPITNWRGYCSKYNFAAAATRGGKNAVAGFIFEKMNASTKKGVNDTAGLHDENKVIYDVLAYKSWFVIDDLIVALGSGITNLDPEQEGTIRTSIDQTVWEGDITSTDETIPLDGETHTLTLADDGIPWVAQDGGFAYAVLTDQTAGSVELTAERRPTQWDELSGKKKGKKYKGKTEEPETVDMLQLTIDHGRTVTNGTYGYMVYAGSEDPAQYFNAQKVEVLSNTTELQAVMSADGRVVQAVFYDPSTELKAGEHTFTVSAPCAFMAEYDESGNAYLTVTDAEVNPDMNEFVVTADGKDVRIALPQEPHRGKPATILLRSAEQ